MNISVLIKKHPLHAYYLLLFLISWGFFIVVGGQGFFAGTNWQTDPMFLTAVTGLLLGPIVSGILSIAINSGKAGLRELLSRLFRWRVNLRWYMAAFLIAPVVEITVLLLLSQISPVFLPKIFTENNKLALLMSGLTIGLVGGLVEEIGWTGFAIPKFRTRFSILVTGLIMGIFWGIWHMPQMWWVGSTSHEALPASFFLTLYFLLAIAQLTAYRVLMVWVYDHTKSLLISWLMHTSYIISTLIVLAPPTTGSPFLLYSGLFTFAMWIVVALAYAVDHKRFISLTQ